MQTLRLNKLVFSPAPAGPITASVGYRLLGAANFTMTHNVAVNADGVLPVPVNFSLNDNTDYEIIAKSTCGNHSRVETVRTPNPATTTMPPTTTIPPTTTTTTTVPPTYPFGTLRLTCSWGMGGAVRIKALFNTGEEYLVEATATAERNDIPYGNYKIVDAYGFCPDGLTADVQPAVNSLFTFGPNNTLLHVYINCH